LAQNREKIAFFMIVFQHDQTHPFRLIKYNPRLSYRGDVDTAQPFLLAPRVVWCPKSHTTDEKRSSSVSVSSRRAPFGILLLVACAWAGIAIQLFEPF
jgi:hypothetical protein